MIDRKEEFSGKPVDQITQLKSHIKLLGALLGDTVQKVEGDEVFKRIEIIRQFTKQDQLVDEQTQDGLLDLLKSIPDKELLPVVRAFTHFLHLANVAERHSEDSLSDFSNATWADNFDYSAIANEIYQTDIELVLTAHPTEITRRSTSYKYREISDCLSMLDQMSPSKNPVADADYEKGMARLKELIMQLWHTPEFREAKPTPLDEVAWGLDVVEKSLWNAVPKFLRQLDKHRSLGALSPQSIESNPVRFASWMGGDRDGNPNVTASITLQAIRMHRRKALELYVRDIQSLIDELSISSCNEQLRIATQNAREPYRTLLREIRSLIHQSIWVLDAAIVGKPISESPKIVDIKQLHVPLKSCYESLIEVGLSEIAKGKLLDVIRRVECFGLYLMRLDIRQESGRHAEAIAEIVDYYQLGSYQSWSEEEKQKFLLAELESRRPLIGEQWQLSSNVQEVLDTCRMVAESTSSAIASYVISMARYPSDVLAVKLLLKICGVTESVPVVPLFETLDDLNAAAEVIGQLFKIDEYRETLGGEQMVMIGYSDSAKDAGMMAAGWAQYQAQEQLLSVGQQHKINILLFHGRGGTVGRGGAPAHAALLSQPPGSLHSGLRVTIQGEMIQAQLGSTGLACGSLMNFADAVYRANACPPPLPKKNWRIVMDRLAKQSCDHYREIVQRSSTFSDYFYTATPIRELSTLPLGSRPAKRYQDGGIEAIRAIPWIFSWSQNRLMLPSWLGAGQSLLAIIEAGDQDNLEAMCEKWPFFSTRLSLLEMVYIKASPEMSAHFDSCLVPEELRSIGKTLRSQLLSDIETVLKIANEESLMQNLPREKALVRWREAYTDPLNLLQAELLARYRKDKDSVVTSALAICISGVAAGMRNTG
jgi:phosphoenolpyruvate carboxylase